MSATTAESRTGRLSRPLVVVTAVVAAVVVNLVVFGIGAALGGTYEFSVSGELARVNAATVAGFSAIPLGVGLTLAALVAARLPVLLRVGVVVAPLLALATIVIMTIPADLDTTSTWALALCHVTLAPISVLALRALGAPQR